MRACTSFYRGGTNFASRGKVQTGEEQEDDDDRVSINAPADDNLLAGEDGGGQSPPTTEDERALMHAETESPGVSEDMSTLTVAADEAPQ